MMEPAQYRLRNDSKAGRQAMIVCPLAGVLASQIRMPGPSSHAGVRDCSEQPISRAPDGPGKDSWPRAAHAIVPPPRPVAGDHKRCAGGFEARCRHGIGPLSRIVSDAPVTQRPSHKETECPCDWIGAAPQIRPNLDRPTLLRSTGPRPRRGHADEPRLGRYDAQRLHAGARRLAAGSGRKGQIRIDHN